MSGLFKSRPVQTTQSQNYNNTSTQTGEQTSRQKQAFNALGDYLMQAISQGPVVSQGEKNLARTGINDTFDASRNRLESALTSRGFGNSGKLGAGFKGLELARNKEIQASDINQQQLAQQRYQQLIGDTLAYSQPFNFSSTQSGTSEGIGTQPGPSYFDRIFNYALGGALGASALGWQPFKRV